MKLFSLGQNGCKSTIASGENFSNDWNQSIHTYWTWIIDSGCPRCFKSAVTKFLSMTISFKQTLRDAIEPLGSIKWEDA